MNFTRKYVFPVIVIILLLGSQLVQAQRHSRMDRADRERIEARKVAYITDRLDLTPEEAQKFWPVYNQHEDAVEQERKSLHENLPDREVELTDEEASKFIKLLEKHEQKMVDLKKKFHSDLKEVLSPKKIVLLIETEKRFREDLIRHISGVRGREGRR